MKTIDVQLEDALARAKRLEADAQAGSALLTEASKQADDLRQRLTTLTTDNETLVLTNGELTEQRDQLTSDLASAKQSLTSAASAAEELTKASELITRFKAITEPAAQTAYWRSLTAEQRTLILNAQ